MAPYERLFASLAAIGSKMKEQGARFKDKRSERASESSVQSTRPSTTPSSVSAVRLDWTRASPALAFHHFACLLRPPPPRTRWVAPPTPTFDRHHQVIVYADDRVCYHALPLHSVWGNDAQLAPSHASLKSVCPVCIACLDAPFSPTSASPHVPHRKSNVAVSV